MNNKKDNIMLKKCIVYGAFAAFMAFSAAIAVSSCNEDEEYGGNGSYTLAKKRVTRAAENTEITYPQEGIRVLEGTKMFQCVDVDGMEADIVVTWTNGYTGWRQPRSTPNFTLFFRELPWNVWIAQERTKCAWSGERNVKIEYVYSYYVNDIMVRKSVKFTSELNVPVELDTAKVKNAGK